MTTPSYWLTSVEGTVYTAGVTSTLGSGTTIFASGVTTAYYCLCDVFTFQVLDDFLDCLDSSAFFLGKDLPLTVLSTLMGYLDSFFFLSSFFGVSTGLLGLLGVSTFFYYLALPFFYLDLFFVSFQALFVFY